MDNIQVIIRTTYHTTDEEVKAITDKLPDSVQVVVKKVYKDSKEYYEFHKETLSKRRRKKYLSGKLSYTQAKKRDRVYARGYKVTDSNNNERIFNSMKELTSFFGYSDQTLYEHMRKSNYVYGYKVERIM